MNLFSFRARHRAASGNVTINGRKFTGNSVEIDGEGRIVVDGKRVDGAALLCPISVQVVGDAEHVETRSGDVVISGRAGSVTTASGDVKCGDVSGNVTVVSGDVQCGAVGASVSTVSGDILRR